MATTNKHAADFVRPASPLHPPQEKTTIRISPITQEKTTIRISPIKPSPRLGLPYITHDLIHNILTRLPPRSVARFRSVCKAWLATISDPYFLDAHLQAAKKRPSLLMVPTTLYETHAIPFFMGFYKYLVGEEAELVHFKQLCGRIKMRNTPVHCDGMIVMAAKAGLMMICNPATGEVVRLPHATIGVFNLDGHVGYEGLIPFTSRTGLGLDPRSNKYKVARFFYQYGHTGQEDTVCKFEVLTLGTNVWRPTADHPPYPIAGRTPVHVQGFIYWMIIDTTTTTWGWGYPPHPPHAFLRFSLADEKFGLVPCPPSDYKPARFVPSESELCCTCFCEQKGELEVWSLSVGQENPQWTRRCNVVIGSDLILPDYNGLPRRSPKVVLHGRTTLILTAERKVYQYDMHTNRMQKIASNIHDIRHYDRRYYEKNMVLHLTNYVESLVRINEL